VSTESERLAELVTDLSHRLAQAFGDVISPEAQRHLRIAQREALSALFLIYEEQLNRRTGRTPADAAGDDRDDRDDWPQDMEEAIRWAGVEPEAETDGGREAPLPPGRSRRSPNVARPSRVKKIELD
jgi:hypothetical protein